LAPRKECHAVTHGLSRQQGRKSIAVAFSQPVDQSFVLVVDFHRAAPDNGQRGIGFADAEHHLAFAAVHDFYPSCGVFELIGAQAIKRRMGTQEIGDFG
jgi:hypothetical protein